MIPKLQFILLAMLVVPAAVLTPNALAQSTALPKSDDTEWVLPSQADPAVQQHNDANAVILPQNHAPGVPLAIFLPGTHGRPQNALALLHTIAGQGYRVIGLSYDDAPSLSQVCPKRPDPACSGRFREMRTFDHGPAPVDNPPAEAINGRLIALLKYLVHEHPADHWGDYLTPEGRPQWNRILVSGLSQGAGMAAFIAKFYPVYRVVLFSSPWDVTGADRHPAPWLSRPSATPAERWWAERHAREKTTELIAHAYKALGIPPDQILIFNRGLGSVPKGSGENPYHGSTIQNTEYQPEWQRMYGTADSRVE